jgi:hypothetical protein
MTECLPVCGPQCKPAEVRFAIARLRDATVAGCHARRARAQSSSNRFKIGVMSNGVTRLEGTDTGP